MVLFDSILNDGGGGLWGGSWVTICHGSIAKKEKFTEPFFVKRNVRFVGKIYDCIAYHYNPLPSPSDPLWGGIRWNQSKWGKRGGSYREVGQGWNYNRKKSSISKVGVTIRDLRRKRGSSFTVHSICWENFGERDLPEISLVPFATTLFRSPT